MRTAFLAAAMVAIAGVMSHFATVVQAANVSGLQSSARKASPSRSLSLPLFFEPNQGQTAPQVKFLARGPGYSLFLTADEAVLRLQRNATKEQSAASSVVRMHLDGVSSMASVSGAELLSGKSSYFIGSDPSKWHREIPQFGRVEYKSVYPGVDLVYYGERGQLEYDFRVAPGADPKQIAMIFNGASAHIAAGDSGDLVLTTANGDVHFRAPRVYQPAVSRSGIAQKTVAGSFRQLADNKIGFTVGAYDRSRELIIDPTLSYSSFLGGSGSESSVQLAVDSALNIYLAGATNSTDFPVTDGSTLNPAPNAQNLFISKINPLPPAGSSQLVYSIYLGGSETDTPTGIAVDANQSIYVAGTTSSPDFPTTSNGFQPSPLVPGTHGFVSKISASNTLAYTLTYSSYLAGNGTDNVTGLAIDGSFQNVYVTGNTTSTNPASDYFPANPNAYQLLPATSGSTPEFFASKINTSTSGQQSMLYSTYFGGGNFPVGVAATAAGGGIAVDQTSTNVSMYITGTTNALPLPGPQSQPAFPLLNPWQSCLDESGKTTCSLTNPTNTDAYIAKINPNFNGTSSLIYSSYLGGSGIDTGLAIAVDTSGNAYVAGSTNSSSTAAGDWGCSDCVVGGFQTTYGGGASDGFVAEIGSLIQSQYPMIYFTYVGGSGADSALAVQVDAVSAIHVAGSTTSPDLLTLNPLQPSPSSSYNGAVYGGGGDAFAALIATNLSGRATGDYLTYLGGSDLDEGTSIALDVYNATYVAGTTESSTFPISVNAYQPTLKGSSDAFVSKIGSASTLSLTAATNSPDPSPAPAGMQVAFTFNITNGGPDNASNVTFYASVPVNGLLTPPSAKVTSGSGNCTVSQGNLNVSCIIPSLTAGSIAAVEVDVTASPTSNITNITVSGQVSANGGPITATSSQTVQISNFSITASTPTPSIIAGNPATVSISFCPSNPIVGYTATITPSQSIAPSMVTSTTPTFTPVTVQLNGQACGSTTLSIATVARPITTGSLFRSGSFYAAWLPIAGLSLAGFGVGASRKRRRWLIAMVLCFIAAVILLQPGCGSSSSTTTTTGGTAAGTYAINVQGSAGAGASQNATVYIVVH
jgi:hypothetical protein